MSKKSKKAEPNYRRDYKCAICGIDGVRLWRDYNTCASAVDLRCVVCAAKLDKKLEGPFVFADGDQLGGLVPAVPTEDGSTFWGYSSVDGEGVLWWNALPVYKDNDKAQAASLQNILLRQIAGANSLYKRWQEAEGKLLDALWQLERKLFIATEPFTLTIWGTKTVKVDDEHIIRFGEDQPHEMKKGDRIALWNDRAVVVLDDKCYRKCPSITDCHGAGLSIVGFFSRFLQPVGL